MAPIFSDSRRHISNVSQFVLLDVPSANKNSSPNVIAIARNELIAREMEFLLLLLQFFILSSKNFVYLRSYSLLLATCTRYHYIKNKSRREVAEMEGFEPSKAFTLLPFQGSALGHYATFPRVYYNKYTIPYQDQECEKYLTV